MILNAQFRKDLRPSDLNCIILNHLHEFNSKPEMVKVIYDKITYIKNYPTIKNKNHPVIKEWDYYDEALNRFYPAHDKFPDIKYLQYAFKDKPVKIENGNYSIQIYEELINYLDQQIIKIETEHKISQADTLDMEDCQALVKRINNYVGRNNSEDVQNLIKTTSDLEKIKDVEFLVGDYLFPRGYCSVIYSEPGQGKTWNCLDIGKSLADGELIFGKYSSNPLKVLFFEGDAPEDLIKSRMNLFEDKLQNNANLKFVNRIAAEVNNISLGFGNDQGTMNIEKIIESAKPDFVIFDTVGSFFDCDENKQVEVFPRIKTIKNFAEKYNCHIMLVHHARKRSAGENRKSLDQSDMIGSTTFNKFTCHLIAMSKSYDKETMQPKENTGVITFTKSWYKHPKSFNYRIVNIEKGQRKAVKIEYDHNVVQEPVATTKYDRLKNILIREISIDPSLQLRITNIAQEYKVHENTVRPVIKELENEGFLKKVPAGKNTYYISSIPSSPLSEGSIDNMSLEQLAKDLDINNDNEKDAA